MKKQFAFFITAITLLSIAFLCSFASADVDSIKASSSEAAASDEDEQEGNNKDDTYTPNKSFFDEISDFFSIINNGFDFGISIKKEFLSIPNGGFNYGDRLNKIISSIYMIIYPVGFAVLILSWGFSVGKGGISCAIDLKDKSSLIYSMLALIIGIFAMTVSPWVLSTLTNISHWLCGEIYTKTELRQALSSMVGGFSGDINLTAILLNENLYNIIVFLVGELVLILNILWVALLQVLSPLFVSFFASTKAKKIATNFLKEYFKALLIPPITIVYLALCTELIVTQEIASGLIISIVLAISTVSVAGKKLDKLIN